MSLSSVSFIDGLSLGMEYVEEIPEEHIPNSIVIDILFLRFVIKIG